MSKEHSLTPSHLAWLITALAFLLYLASLAPTVVWQDSAMFQVRVWQGDLTGNLGLALSHPLYIALAKGFSWLVPGDFAWRVNVFSGVCSAAAIGFVFAGVRRLTSSVWPALVAAVLLAVSHTFWTHAVIAEVYGLYGLGLSVEMYCLVRYWRGEGPGKMWWLVGLFLANGLNVSNHMLAMLHLPACGIYALVQLEAKRIRLRELALMGLAWLAGVGFYAGVIVWQIVEGGGIADTLRSAAFGLYWQERVVGQMPDAGGLAKCIGYFVLNFPTPLLLLSPAGIYLAIRKSSIRSVAAVWLGLCAVAFVFACRYRVADQYVFFFPCYIMTAVFVGLGIHELGSRWSLMNRTVGKVIILILAVLPAAAYEIGPWAVREIRPLKKIADKVLRVERAIPGRDAYAYFLRPRKNNETSAREFCFAALAMADPNGLIIANDTVRNPMVYLQKVEHAFTGVWLSEGADLKGPNEVAGDLGSIQKWLILGDRVFMVSPARQSKLVEQLNADGRFKLRFEGRLYEVELVEE